MKFIGSWLKKRFDLEGVNETIVGWAVLGSIIFIALIMYSGMRG